MFETVAFAFGIFTLRVLGNAVTTLRLVMLSRDKRFMVFVLSFTESLIFALAIGSVVNNLNSVLNLTAYAGGFAVGGNVGMWLERRLTLGYVRLVVTSKSQGHEIAVALRDAGFGVTEIVGYGADGERLIVESVMERSSISNSMKIIQKIDPAAFITLQNLHSTRSGYFTEVRPGLSRILSRH